MSSSQEHDESLVGGRQRRSAAAKNKAWSTLMGTGKHKVEDEEDHQDASAVSRPTPRSAPRKKPKVEAKAKSESVSPPKPILTQEKKVPLIPAQAPRLFSAKTANPTENGAKNTAAFGKEQIENIEKEMFKTYMSNEEEEFTESDAEDSLQDLLDEDDEEFKPKRTYGKRGAAPARSSNIRGRGGLKNPSFVSRTAAANFSQRPMQNMMATRDGPPAMNSRFVVRPPTLKYASSAAVNVYENRPIKTIVLRKNDTFGNGDGPRDSPRVPMTISSMSVQSNKQIEEINKKFGTRVVAGDSVQKFNGLIETLVGELKLMAEDRERMIRNHQELTEQMNLSHSTALDIKDSRIRQLENCVSKLQDQMAQLVSNLQASYSQHESVGEKPDTVEDEDEEMQE